LFRSKAPVNRIAAAASGFLVLSQPFGGPERYGAATGQTADVMKKCYSNAVKGAQDYSNKVVDFTQANTNTAFDFAQRLSGVKSPSEFVELSTEHARQQLETLTNQTTQLAALAQRVSLATAEPLQTGFANHLTGRET
jgi:phasin